MNGFNDIFASDIDDQTIFDTVFTDDIEDKLIDIVAGTDLYTESGEEIEFEDMTGDEEDDEDEEISSTDNLEKTDDEDDSTDEPEEDNSTIEPGKITTSGDLDNYINRDSDDEECPEGDCDNEVAPPPVNVITTSDLNKVILFDTTGDVGDTEEPEVTNEPLAADEACKKEESKTVGESLEESAKNKFSKKKMTTADLEAAINGSSKIESDDLEAPDEDLIDDTESDDIDSVGESTKDLL